MTRLKKICRNKLAFSLVELVVVLAIMALIIGLAVPNLRALDKKRDYDDFSANLEDVLQQANTIVNAFNTYKETNARHAWVGGYRVETPRGMLDCLRTENDYGNLFDIEISFSATAPDKSKYNYRDVIIVCIQFYENVGNDLVLIEREDSDQNIVPSFDEDTAKMAVLKGAWYIAVSGIEKARDRKVVTLPFGGTPAYDDDTKLGQNLGGNS